MLQKYIYIYMIQNIETERRSLSSRDGGFQDRLFRCHRFCSLSDLSPSIGAFNSLCPVLVLAVPCLSIDLWFKGGDTFHIDSVEIRVFRPSSNGVSSSNGSSQSSGFPH